MDKKFKPLDYSRGWDDYWRDHPQGYSPQEQMINWSGQLNAMIDFFNEYFDVDLTEYATDVMEGWYFDGRLDEIINDVLFDSKADKTTVNALIDTLAQTETRLNTGDIYGVPVLDNLKDKKIEVVAGAIRQNEEDRTKWDFISDSLHQPIGVSGTQATASGSTITIDYAKTYSKVLCAMVGPDEYLANAHNLSVGASVGVDKMQIRASGSIEGFYIISWNGTEWVKVTGTGQDIGGADKLTLSYSSGFLTVNHGYCRGSNVSITPYTADSGSQPPFTPVLYGTLGHNSFKVRFIDHETGSYITDGVPRVGMSFIFNKSYAEGLHLDGSNGSEDLNLHLGNLWFYGIFEV